MADTVMDRHELARRGQAYYDQHLRETLEPQHNGKYLVLDVETGEYEMDADQVVAMQRARARHPTTVFYIVRVGYPAVGRIGARLRRRPS